MDDKNIKNRRLMGIEKITDITVQDFINIAELLEASNEDFELALENIKNLNFDLGSLLLFMKPLNLNRRMRFYDVFIEDLKNYFSSKHSIGEDLTLEKIHNMIFNSNNELSKEVFEKTVTKIILNSYSTANMFDFIKEIDIKIKW